MNENPMIQSSQFTMRVYAMAAGLYGTAVAMIIDALYSVFHILGAGSSAASSSTYFVIGLGFIILALSGSCIVPVNGTLAALFLLVAPVGLFFVLGWWALLCAPLLVLAAILAYLDHNRSERSYPAVD